MKRRIEEEEEICNFYASIQLEIGHDFFVNNLNVDKWTRMRLFGKLRKTVDNAK